MATLRELMDEYLDNYNAELDGEAVEQDENPETEVSLRIEALDEGVSLSDSANARITIEGETPLIRDLFNSILIGLNGRVVSLKQDFA